MTWRAAWTGFLGLTLLALLTLGVLALTVQGCSAAPASPAPQIAPGSVIPATPADSPPAAGKGPLLQLGPGDSVNVQVYGQPDLSTTQYVGDDGTLSIPLAGAAEQPWTVNANTPRVKRASKVNPRKPVQAARQVMRLFDSMINSAPYRYLT
jgi:hypothetical protein